MPPTTVSTTASISASTDTSALITDPHLDAPDDFYEALIEAHQGLSTDESNAFNARLLLVLANHVGSLAVLRQAIAAAATATTADTTEPAA
jgi:hypothetical protein